MSKILGLDLGTNSIGLAVRDTDKGPTIQDQIIKFAVTRFKSGVGNGKSGEFSYAAERTKHRSSRRLYQARRYRIWATLKLLIEYGYCPLSKEDLEKWSKYDKAKGLKRQYPVDAKEFEQWVRLDFNGDGVADYSSPYQLRAELMEKQFDFSLEEDRYKLGRALYHIAQRRGFRSSKGETIKEQEQAADENNVDTEMEDLSTLLKESEEKKSCKLSDYMEKFSLPTIGCAFYKLEQSGIRVRNSEYQAVRSQYKEEISAIFKFQQGLSNDSDFYKRLVSEKKGEGTIFYKRSLRRQTSLVGKCTLEPNKKRCPISHPEFEKFRAWSFINNIQYRKTANENWCNLTIEQKQKLYQNKFLRVCKDFNFKEIREWIQNDINKDSTYKCILNYKHKSKSNTINYSDDTNVSGCPVSGRLKKLFGDNWEIWNKQTNKERKNYKEGTHRIQYDINDIWHICFSCDELENVVEFAANELGFDNTEQFVKTWDTISQIQGYSRLSLKAIKNINRFLLKGLIYTDAVLLAKLPEIFGDKWSENEDAIVSQIDDLIAQNRKEKQLLNMANTLIANYKSLIFNEEDGYNEKFAERNYNYQLQPTDYNDVKKAIIDAIGENTWANTIASEQNEMLESVTALYQQFFSSRQRDYFHLPKLSDALAKYLRGKYPLLTEKDLKKIYHPSSIEYYPPAKQQKIEDGRYIKLLGSPVIGAMKNPMAMRVLHTLRKQINYLLKEGVIDEETRIVVETARELNDANWRWTIRRFQEERESENKEFEKIIRQYNPKRIITNEDIDKARLLLDQHDVQDSDNKNCNNQTDNKNQSKNEKIGSYKKDVTKYRLWLEQGCRCIYTGKFINIQSLFSEEKVDFEHTIPRSISFDNSLSNLTVCDAHFNRTVKKNQIPSQLPKDLYDDILTRIQPWMAKVKTLEDNIEYYKLQSKRAQDKERKDYCIRQRHLWELELDYWQKKVNAFKIKEVTSGFRNSQLNDTRIITKYAYHYLKTIFNKVDVQNGRYTADFRKMLKIQSIDEKKNREKHSHHAIDATVLTMIPVAAKRDRMLEMFYQIEEGKKNSEDVKTIENKLTKEIHSCHLCKNISSINEFVEQNILVNLVSKDQTLTPAKRKRVKKVKGENGETMKVVQWITGDCIRGQLHKESFFGAIKPAKTEVDENNTEKLLLKRDQDGRIITEDDVKYVIRRELKWKKSDSDNGFKNWDELEKAIVNKCLINMMKQQFPQDTAFKDACQQGIYMLDNYGNKINRIRHVRCFASVKNPLKIKEQTYKSNKEYKHNYYADMGDLYSLCKYENREKQLYKYIIWSLFDISENRKNKKQDIPKEIKDKKTNEILSLQYNLIPGKFLLLYKQTKDELKTLNDDELSKRLYEVVGFENTGFLIKLKRHINAKSDKELGKGESVKNGMPLPEKIRCSVNTLQFVIEGIDFDISPIGEIRFHD